MQCLSHRYANYGHLHVSLVFYVWASVILQSGANGSVWLLQVAVNKLLIRGNTRVAFCSFAMIFTDLYYCNIKVMMSPFTRSLPFGQSCPLYTECLEEQKYIYIYNLTTDVHHSIINANNGVDIKYGKMVTHLLPMCISLTCICIGWVV